MSEQSSARTAGQDPGGSSSTTTGESLAWRMSRRQLLRYGGAAGVAVTIPSVLAACGGSGDKAAVPGPRQVLTKTEATDVEALLERMIPSDGSGPGAKEAKVWRYIDGALASDYKELAPMYKANLKALDTYSRNQHDKGFAELDGDQQDTILTAVEKGKATGFTPDSTTFFQTLRQHAMEGMFGDPHYGGNTSFAGWQLIGFPGITLSVPPEYQRLDVKVPLNSKSIASYTSFDLTSRI